MLFRCRTFYPVFLNVKDKLWIIVGGGEVSARKAASLLASGANVRVISPHFSNDFNHLSQHEKLQLIQRSFKEQDINEAFLVIAATDNSLVNQYVAVLCDKDGLLCNVVDAPLQGNFIAPSVIQQGSLTIAISTGGNAPAAAKQIRERLQTEFDEAYGEVLEALGQARTAILTQVSDIQVRRKMLTALKLDEFVELFRSDGRKGIDEKVKEIMDFNCK